MPLPLTVSCFSKIQIGFSFLVPAHLGSPGERAVKRGVCVCVCPSCRPTNSIKETEGKPSIMRLQCKSTNLQPAVASPMPHWTLHDRYAGTQHCRAVHTYHPSAIHFPVKNDTTNGKTSRSYHFGGLPLNWPVPLTFPKLLKSHYFSQAFNNCWFLCFS